MQRYRFILWILLAAFSQTGCTVGSLSGDVYTREQARKAYQLSYARVIAVREVLIEGTKSKVGTVAGAALGAAAGSAVGDGSGRRIATAAGGVAGGLAGAAAEESLTRQTGQEITVELDSGEVIVVVQSAEDAFRVGERVRVLRRGGGEARVVR